MDEATSVAAELRSLAPLRIHEVQDSDPVLTVIGDDWSAALVGEWAWRRGDQTVTCWAAADAEDVVWDLCGLDLVDVLFPDSSFAGDCSFVLSDGRLDVRSDRSGFETWSFRHARLGMVFIGL
jgi:hypothetical protein